MKSVKKPKWQQSTALVSLTTCGAMTGFAFAHGTLAELTSPTSVPANLLAFNKPAQPETTNEGALRSAIVKVATYYLRMARDNSPAQMQALIWQGDSVNGADHGESCAAFASLVLEKGAQATGQQSWATGGGTYPWPLHGWADVRVEPNANSPNVVSILQDAQAHHRWHAVGAGYTPQSGDFVLFDGHVEVVTKYAGGVLYTIGGDSAPNLSVNAHQYGGPLDAQGVLGFVNNGEVVTTASVTVPGEVRADLGHTAIPGLMTDVPGSTGSGLQVAQPGQQDAGTRTVLAAASGGAAIPGLLDVTGNLGAGQVGQSSPGYSRHHQPTAQVPDTATQQAFISAVAPGAVAAQRTFGIPAAVTIAQAIDESGWGQSELATQDHNLFGIKGAGPAGSVDRPTTEYENGNWVATTASFRVYHSVAESIADHSRLLATGESYKQAMANRHAPDAFAHDLTGIYATDPNYGSSLIALMKLYNLYRYDPAPSAAPTVTATPAQGTIQVAATDHGANVPGLGQVGVGRGARPGGVTRTRAAHGAAQGGSSAGASAQTAGAFAGSGRSGPVRGGTGLGGSTRTGTGADRSTRTGTGADGSMWSGTGGGSVGGGSGPGQARIPGLVVGASVLPVALGSVRGSRAARGPGRSSGRTARRVTVRARTKRYEAQIPSVVLTDFITMAKHPLARSKPMYQDVARRNNVPWQVLAACDWMQCKAQAQCSPVRGERLGAKNSDGTRYRTRSAALEQCAADLIALSDAVYGIDLTAPLFLSVLELAQVFAAFRWGGLLKEHRISAMEFPYSVEGLTVQHLDLRWPDVDEPNAPDKPGARFRMPFGAVPIVLTLDYPAVA